MRSCAIFLLFGVIGMLVIAIGSLFFAPMDFSFALKIAGVGLGVTVFALILYALGGGVKA